LPLRQLAKEYFYTLLGSGEPRSPSLLRAAYSVAVGPSASPIWWTAATRAACRCENQVTLPSSRAGPSRCRSASRRHRGNLAQSCPTRAVVYPQSRRRRRGSARSTDIQRFDSTPGEGVVVEALWKVQGQTASEAAVPWCANQLEARITMRLVPARERCAPSAARSRRNPDFPRRKTFERIRRKRKSAP